MEEILVSVIIPAYNCSRYIRQAVDSALVQDVPLEVLVLDSCSQDDLATVMEAYAEDARVRYLPGDRNIGVAATRNRGVAMARGEYIAFLDADDAWAPGKLKKQLARMGETGDVLCSTARELMRPDGSRTGYVLHAEERYTFRDLARQNLVNCSSVLIKTEVARAFPMHHDDAHEDYLMWLEVLQAHGTGCAVDEPLLYYRISNQGKSGSKWKSAKMTLRTYQYMKFGKTASAFYFCCYVFTGVKKYFGWFWRSLFSE